MHFETCSNTDHNFVLQSDKITQAARSGESLQSVADLAAECSLALDGVASFVDGVADGGPPDQPCMWAYCVQL
jgi:hypothetical protein